MFRRGGGIPVDVLRGRVELIQTATKQYTMTIKKVSEREASLTVFSSLTHNSRASTL